MREDLTKNKGLDAKEAERRAEKEYPVEFAGSFENCLDSFMKLDCTIDLINELKNKSAFVAKKFSL